MPSPPIVADFMSDGRTVKAVIEPTKQGWLYVLDRVTGQPVWPIVEKPVPQSDVPGEKTSATQPFPPEALRYARNAYKFPEDLIDFTPQLRNEAVELLKRYKTVSVALRAGRARRQGRDSRRHRQRHRHQLAGRRL